jgi:basic amino acid/polyamine antiporter, APA family
LRLARLGHTFGAMAATRSTPTASPPRPPHRAGPTRGLLRVLGVLFGAAIIVGNTIASGILRTPGDVAAALPSPAWFLGVWVLGGIYAMCGAMTMAELAAMLPKSGGQYVYARRAMGEYAGFVIGWTDWISSAASIAAGAIALGELTGALWPSLASSGTLVAVVVTVFFTSLHWLGVRSGDLTTQLWGIVKVGTLLAVAVACLIAAPAPASATAAAFPSGLALAGAMVIALQSVLYTYDGWTGYTYFGGEVRDPKHIPRAMALGVLLVTAVYVALNWSFLHVLGIDGLAGEKFAARSAAIAVFGASGDGIVSAVMAVSLLGGVSALIMLTSRVPFALADDGLLPRAVARVNKGGTPDISLLGTAVVVLLLIMTGTFSSVLALAAFFFVMQYGVSFTSLFILRWREPDLPRPYRAIGYPVIPAIVLLGAVAFVVGSFFGDRANTLKSVVVLVASYPLYRLVIWLRARSVSK